MWFWQRAFLKWSTTELANSLGPTLVVIVFQHKVTNKSANKYAIYQNQLTTNKPISFSNPALGTVKLYIALNIQNNANTIFVGS